MAGPGQHPMEEQGDGLGVGHRDRERWDRIRERKAKARKEGSVVRKGLKNLKSEVSRAKNQTLQARLFAMAEGQVDEPPVQRGDEPSRSDAQRQTLVGVPREERDRMAGRTRSATATRPQLTAQQSQPAIEADSEPEF